MLKRESKRLELSESARKSLGIEGEWPGPWTTLHQKNMEGRSMAKKAKKQAKVTVRGAELVSREDCAMCEENVMCVFFHMSERFSGMVGVVFKNGCPNKD